MSPAKVAEVKILPRNSALCIVPEDQLSLAIGKDGQNVRLAAKLTGWKIDIRPEGADIEEVVKEAEKEAGVESAEEVKEPSPIKKEEVKEKKEKKTKVKKTKKEAKKE
jgi:N utilization substance protein A